MTLKIKTVMLALATVLSAMPIAASGTDERQAPGLTEGAARIERRAPSPETMLPHRKKKSRVKGTYTSARTKTAKPRKAVRKAAASTDVTIYGTVAKGGSQGIYSFTTADNTITPVKQGIEYGVTAGFLNDGVFYGSSGFVNDGSDNTKAYGWNVNTWEEEFSKTELGKTIDKLAIDPLSGIVYAYAYENNTLGLYTLNQDFTFRDKICDYNDYVYRFALFFDQKGNLYMFDDCNVLYSVDKETGEEEELGELDVDTYWAAAATVDPASGLCYLYAQGEEETDCLYEINLDDLSAVLLYEFDTDMHSEGYNLFYSIFIIPEGAAGGAPAKCDNLALDFAGTSLSGKVKFTAPSTDVNGTAGSGSLSYTLTVNADTYTTASCNWGEAVEVDYTAAEAGQYMFSVTFSNAEGTSDASSVSAWIGADAPRGVTGLRASCYENVVTLVWNAPEGSVHGGYIVPEEVTYRVTRMPEGLVVAQALTAPGFTDTYPEMNNPVEHTYKVESIWDGNASDAVVSNRVMVGTTFFNGFDNNADMAVMTTMAEVSGENEWRIFSDYRYSAAGVDYDMAGSTVCWMISPAMKLEAGRTYTLSFEAWGSSNQYSERLWAYITNTKVASEIYNSTPIVSGDEVQVTWEWADRMAFGPLGGKFTPTVEDDYYITIVANSLKDNGTPYIDNLMLVKDPIVALPSAPEISAVLGDNLDVTVTLTAPTTDTDGEVLTALTKVVLSRDGNEVKTFETPDAGQTLTYSEILPAAGVYVYSAAAYNENGFSAEATATVSAVEAGKPGQPLVPTAKEGSTLGEVTLTWTAPLRDVNGNPLDASTLTYNIYKVGEAEPIATGVSGTEYTYTAVEAGKQAFLSFVVTAVNAAGESLKSNATAPAAYGTPDKLPYSESFAGMDFENVWNFDPVDPYMDAEWIIVAASETPAAQPQDGDGGMLAFCGPEGNVEDQASVTSGKIDLTGAQAPKLSLWYFAQNKSEGKDELHIYVNDGSGFKKVDQFSMRDEAKNGWSMRTVDLKNYAGKVINLRLNGVYYRTDNFLLVDNIRVYDAEAEEGTDVEAYLLQVPAEVYAGNAMTGIAIVKNNYNESVSNVLVKLYVNNQLATQGTVNRLEAGALSGVSFNFSPDAAMVGSEVAFRFEVSLAGDLKTDNNVSPTKTVKIKQLELPTVAALAAEYADDSHSAATVSWHSPDFAGNAGKAYTENFEAFEVFAIDPVSEWKFVDGDGQRTYGPNTWTYPGANSPKAFVVFDDIHSSFGAGYNAKSGNKYVAAYSTEAQSDDWMISPELTGEAQTITFFARAYTIQPTYGAETFEVMASKSGDEEADFTVVKAFTATTSDWTEYSVELPAGSKYFALHYTGYDAFATFFDDVTYAAKNHPAAGFEIVGYNVYRDGVRVNAEPLPTMSYTDSNIGTANHSYALSVVYDRGESPLSESVMIGESGLEDVAATGVAVRALSGAIEVETTASVPVNVFTVEGRAVYAGTADGRLYLPVAKGFYMVTAGGSTYKLIVE